MSRHICIEDKPVNGFPIIHLSAVAHTVLVFSLSCNRNCKEMSLAYNFWLLWTANFYQIVQTILFPDLLQLYCYQIVIVEEQSH
jgi:hypothetical protein